jgi:hypothetical protein
MFINWCLAIVKLTVVPDAHHAEMAMQGPMVLVHSDGC